jgi:hypothetical protein
MEAQFLELFPGHPGPAQWAEETTEVVPPTAAAAPPPSQQRGAGSKGEVAHGRASGNAGTSPYGDPTSRGEVEIPLPSGDPGPPVPLPTGKESRNIPAPTTIGGRA